MTNNRRSHAMDGLKLLFMLLIVVHHSGFYEEILHHGYMAVDLFFMISGYFLGRKLPQKWFNVLGMTCTLVVYGFILCFTGGSMETFAKVGVFYLPFWRGMAGLFCGTFLFRLHKRLQPVFHRYAAGFRVLELASLICVITLMCSAGMTDAPILICIFFLLLCVGSEMSVLEHFFNCPTAAVAIRYEYAVFLNHAFVIGMVKKLFVATFGFPDLVNFLVLLTALTVYSVITETLVRNGMQLFSKVRKKVIA